MVLCDRRQHGAGAGLQLLSTCAIRYLQCCIHVGGLCRTRCMANLLGHPGAGAEVKRVRPVSISHPDHFVNVARRRAAETPGAVFADQFENLANMRAHHATGELKLATVVLGRNPTPLPARWLPLLKQSTAACRIRDCSPNSRQAACVCGWRRHWRHHCWGVAGLEAARPQNQGGAGGPAGFQPVQ